MRQRFFSICLFLQAFSILSTYAEVTINGLKYELDVKYTISYCLDANDYYSDEVNEGYVRNHESRISVEGCATVTGSTSSNPSSVDIPSTITYQGKTYKVTSIKPWAFRFVSTTKSNLTSVSIGSNVEFIGSGAFYGTSIQKITIPAGIKEIGSDFKFGYGAFGGCSDLKQVTFKTTQLRHIPICCFAGTAITSITIPEGVSHIEAGAFGGCTKLTQVTLPTTLHTIGNSAFKNCEALTSITIPKGCHIIGDEAFMNAYVLAKVSLPSTLISIGLKAFNDTKIHTNYLASSNTTCSVNNCLLFGGDYHGEKNFTSIPSGTVLIAAGALQYVKKTNISIPSSVKYIGAQPNLNSYFTATEGAYYLGDCLIRVTSNASTTLNVKSNTRVIADYAFSDASQVTTIKLPNTVKYVGIYAMAGDKAVNIPTSLITVGDKAFSGNQYSVSALPTNITYIGDDAFSGKDGKRSTIESLSLSTKVTYWGECSFRWLYINDITIGNGISVIPKAAFYGSSKLKNISLPQSLVTIEKSAFFDKQDWASSTSSITDASQIESIETIVIPNSVKTIGDYAFKNRFILDLTIGAAVTEIGYEAFDMWLSLSRSLWDKFNPTLTFISSTPPTAYCYNGQGEAFSYYMEWEVGDYDNQKYAAEVFVPCDAVDKYTSQCWMQGFNPPSGRRYHLYTAVNNLMMGEVTGGGYISICDNPVTIHANPKNGYEFERWSDGETVNPRIVTIESDTTFTAVFAQKSEDIHFPVNVEENDCKKYLDNGHVYIKRGNNVYSIYGIKIDEF